MAKIISFPVQHACPTCERPCGEDELSTCIRCGQRWCQWDTGECECDKFAREMVQRAGIVPDEMVDPTEIYRLTGRPIEEPAEENVLALQFIREQFGQGDSDAESVGVSAGQR